MWVIKQSKADQKILMQRQQLNNRNTNGFWDITKTLLQVHVSFIVNDRYEYKHIVYRVGGDIIKKSSESIYLKTVED